MNKLEPAFIKAVCLLSKEGFKAEEIAKILDVLEPLMKHKEKPKKEIKIKWHKGRWIKDLAKMKVTSKTMRKLAEIDSLLKLRGMLSAEDIMKHFKCTKSHAISLMHRTAAKLPHIEEFKEKRKLYIVRK